MSLMLFRMKPAPNFRASNLEGFIGSADNFMLLWSDASKFNTRDMVKFEFFRERVDYCVRPLYTPVLNTGSVVAL